MTAADTRRIAGQAGTDGNGLISKRLEHPVRKLVRFPRAGLSLLRETPVVLHRAARMYGLSPAAALRRLGQLYARRFTPNQAFLLGLFDPSVTERELDSAISNHTLHSMQELVNPRAWEQMTEDKAVFYRFCESVGLPTPRLYAIYFRSSGGWSSDQRQLVDAGEWDAYLQSICAKEIVAKPAWGSYGRGILILQREESGWIDHVGCHWTTAKLIDRFKTDPGCDHVVIQERLYSHPDIHQLSPSTGLQTVRLITYVDRRGSVHILFCALKLIPGELVVDNFAAGLHGNLYLEVDVEDGRVKKGVRRDPDRGVLVDVSKHPGTGQDLRGIGIPSWEETRQLAIRAAKAFFPVRAVGWDIAPTAGGPRLIEGNMWFDAPPIRGNSGKPVPFDRMSSDMLDRD